MSVAGTGVAAGVAQVAHQAQQVARQRDKRRTDSAKEADRMQDMLETRLRALEEGEDTPNQLRIDGDVPRHETPKQPPEQQPTDRDKPTLDLVAERPTDPADSAPPPPTPQSPLYRHLDVEV